MVLHIGELIPVILVFQSLIFSLVLYTDRGNKRKANFLLASFFLILGVQFFGIVSPVLGFNSFFFEYMACAYGFAYGPLLYMYSRALIFSDFMFNRMLWLHFVPFLLLIFLALFDVSVCAYIGPMMYLSLISYVFVAIRLLMKYRRTLKQTQSRLGEIALKWLQNFMIIFCVTLLLDIVDLFFISLDLVPGVSSVHLMLLILVNWMFYKGLKQPLIFLGISQEDVEVASQKHTYKTPKAPSEEDKMDLDKLRECLEKSKIYTDPELSINGLAKVLELSPRRLSFLINGFLDNNFIGHVNHYRIELAKERLKDPKKGETIAEIMYDVGFSSKSSFNSAFKAQTGMTPSEYKRTGQL